jgi:hypothetical protein
MKRIVLTMCCMWLISCGREKTLLPKSDIEIIAGQDVPGFGLVESKISTTGKLVYLSSDNIKIPKASIEGVRISKDDFSWGITIRFQKDVGDEIYTLTSSYISKLMILKVNGRCIYSGRVSEPMRSDVRISGFGSEKEAEAMAKKICGFEVEDTVTKPNS